MAAVFLRVGFVVTKLQDVARLVIAFYNVRGTVEQWIKEGKLPLNWTFWLTRTFGGWPTSCTACPFEICNDRRTV